MTRRNLSGAPLGHVLGSLSGSPLSGDGLLGDGDRDPMESMGNLMDVMLVFACGLLLALVANWNIDLASVESSQQASEQIEAELEDSDEAIDLNGGDYTRLGDVYRDEETGRLYLLE